LKSTRITVSFEVDEHGRPRNVHVTKSCGNAEVDNRCEDAVRSRKFKPAVQGGEPQVAHMTHSFDVSN